MIGIEAVQKLLKEDINSLKFEIPDDVFQFNFKSNDSALYLNTHPEVPFILRTSSLKGCFSLDIPAKDRKSIGCQLISQSKVDEKEFKLGKIGNGVFTEFSSLKEFVKNSLKTLNFHLTSSEMTEQITIVLESLLTDVCLNKNHENLFPIYVIEALTYLFLFTEISLAETNINHF